MQPLIDGDILLYEMGFSGQFKDKESGEEVLLPFPTLQEMIDVKISDICSQAGGDEPPIIYLTASQDIVNLANMWPDNNYTYVEGYRYSVAKTKPYKGNRTSPKPYHFLNIAAYLISEYNVKISVDGLEADDMMSIEQTSRDDTIICSRDKDLRIAPGWHYSWECGRQREIGPYFTDSVGTLMKNGDKIIGYGLKFFYYQMLVGDSVDNIPGVYGLGPAKAYTLLDHLTTEQELESVVKSIYKKHGLSQDYYKEQQSLLWIQQHGR